MKFQINFFVIFLSIFFLVLFNRWTLSKELFFKFVEIQTNKEGDVHKFNLEQRSIESEDLYSFKHKCLQTSSLPSKLKFGFIIRLSEYIFTRVTSNIISLILLCLLPKSEVDVCSIAADIEPSQQ